MANTFSCFVKTNWFLVAARSTVLIWILNFCSVGKDVSIHYCCLPSWSIVAACLASRMGSCGASAGFVDFVWNIRLRILMFMLFKEKNKLVVVLLFTFWKWNGIPLLKIYLFVFKKCCEKSVLSLTSWHPEIPLPRHYRLLTYNFKKI